MDILWLCAIDISFDCSVILDVRLNKNENGTFSVHIEIFFVCLSVKVYKSF